MRQLDVLGAVRRVPVVKAQVEARVVALVRFTNAANQLLRRYAFVLRLEHHRCAVRVVGTDEMHGMALHALEAHPDVRLGVFHDVTDMERPIGVRQGSGDEQRAARHAARNLCGDRGIIDSSKAFFP